MSQELQTSQELLTVVSLSEYVDACFNVSVYMGEKDPEEMDVIRFWNDIL